MQWCPYFTKYCHDKSFFFLLVATATKDLLKCYDIWDLLSPVINISFKSLMFQNPWYLGYPQCLPVGRYLERSAQISHHEAAWRVHLVASSPEIHIQTSGPPTAKEKHVSGKYFITRYPGVRLGHQGLVTLCTGRADILCYRFRVPVPNEGDFS